MSNMQAYDRITALTQQIGHYKEQQRQREIDETATGMLLQGAPPEDVERFLVSTIAPEQSGIGGFARRLVGGTPPQMTPMQQRVVGARSQQAFPMQEERIAQQQADQSAGLYPLQRDRLAIGNDAAVADAQRTSDLHPLNVNRMTIANKAGNQQIDQSEQLFPLQAKRLAIGNKTASMGAEQSATMNDAKLRETEANIKRLELLGDPQAQNLRQIGSTLNAYLRSNAAGDYDTEIGELSASFAKLVDRITGDTMSQSPNNGPAQGPQTISEGTTAVNPTTGERIILKDGKWVPINN